MNESQAGVAIARGAAAVALVLIVAGCQTPPPRPLYRPIAEAESYGYSERRIADGNYEVTYVGPRHRVPANRITREANIEALSVQAEEVAELRAAELALASGYAAYRITDRRTDAEVTIENYDFYYPGPYYYPHHRPYNYPFLFGPSYSSQALAQVRSVLTVGMEKAAADDTTDAAARRDLLMQRYVEQSEKRSDKPPGY